jgi:uncharacterized integral membrane protein
MTAFIKFCWKLLVIGSRWLFFAFFFLLALMNSQEVSFYWFVNQSIKVPLMFIILGAFLMGMILTGFAFYQVNRKRSK